VGFHDVTRSRCLLIGQMPQAGAVTLVICADWLGEDHVILELTEAREGRHEYGVRKHTAPRRERDKNT